MKEMKAESAGGAPAGAEGAGRAQADAARLRRYADVRRYEKTRYASWHQRWVDRRERRVLTAWVAELRVPGDRWLDLPCGYGRFTDLLVPPAADGSTGELAFNASDEPGFVVAADLLRPMLRRTRERLGPRVLFCSADIAQLPFRNGAFNSVLVFRLLQHLSAARRRAALAELVRVTTRWLLLSAYTGAPLHRAARRLQRRAPKSLPQRRLEEEFAVAGLRVERRCKILPGAHAQTIYLLCKA